jgi:hypothetical protein
MFFGVFHVQLGTGEAKQHECDKHFAQGAQVYPPFEMDDMTKNSLFLEMMEEIMITFGGKMDDKMKCFAKLMQLKHEGGEKYEDAEEGIHVYANHDARNGLDEGVPILMNDVRQHFKAIKYTEGENFRSVPYDWRHSPKGLEVTYFPYLKTTIEQQVKSSNTTEGKGEKKKQFS